MKLPARLHSLWHFPRSVLKAEWGLEGFASSPARSAWAQTSIVVARSRCRVRWFRLQGVPTAERLSALRLQAQAWQPFERHAARLILWDQLGLAIAWDEAALERDLAVHGLGLDRCLAIPELLVQRPMEAGVRLIRCLEGFEAQCWRAGQLHSSRWWPTAPSPEDWQTFLRAAGQRDELANAEALGSAAIPEPIEVEQAAAPWVKHHALQATGDNGQHQLERRLRIRQLSAIGAGRWRCRTSASGGMAAGTRLEGAGLRVPQQS